MFLLYESNSALSMSNVPTWPEYLVFFCCNENEENILFLILVGKSGNGSKGKNEKSYNYRWSTSHMSAHLSVYYCIY
jgi:hypothetical protein